MGAVPVGKFLIYALVYILRAFQHLDARLLNFTLGDASIAEFFVVAVARASLLGLPSARRSLAGWKSLLG